MYGVWIHDFQKISTKKPVIVRPFSIFSISQYRHQGSSHTSDNTLFTARASRWSLSLCCFLYLNPIPSRRPPEQEWSRPARSLPPDYSPTVRTLSKMAKEPSRSSLWPPRTSWIAPYSFPSKAVWSPTWPTSWRAAGSHKCCKNSFGWHVMDLSEFPDTLLLFIFHFGGDIGDGSLYVKFLWSATTVSPTSPFDKCLYLCSHQGLVMVGLLHNFLNPLKLFLAVASDFMISLWQRMEGVRRER
jgi:hypothetical protein